MVASLPRAGKSVALRVSITPSARGEIWERVFDGKPMTSSLRDRGGLLEESFGPAVLRFALEATPESIAWKLVAVRTFGIPLPIAWFDKVHAHESLDGETYRFDVRAELPLTGLLVHYRGTLDAGA